MVSTTGFGFFNDFFVILQQAGEVWRGNYVGLYPYPLMVLLAPVALLPVDVAAVLLFASVMVAVVLTLRRQSLCWVFFVPFLKCMYLGQLDPLFWIAYCSNRPAVWALLSLKPQLLPALPRLFASRRNAIEFCATAAALHVPFLLIRPTWPMEWIRFMASYQENRITMVPSTTVSAAIYLSDWLLPFAAGLVFLLLLRRKNLEGVLFLANPALLPYDYSLLMGRISRAIIPLSWLTLALAWRVQAGWPYALMLIGVLVIETVRERRAESAKDRDAVS